MSKKRNKKKLKKMIRAKALEEARATSGEIEVTENIPSPQANTKPSTDSQPSALRARPRLKGGQTHSNSLDSARITSEVRKILLTMGIIIIVIIAVYFINQKTDLVLQAGKALTSLLNINL